MPKNKKFHARRASITINLTNMTDYFNMSIPEQATLYSFPTWDELKEHGCRYIVAGLEISPKTEMLHWQGYMEFYTTMTTRGIKKALGCSWAHIEQSYADGNSNEDYCKKDWEENGDGIEYGIKAKDSQGHRKDLVYVADLVREGKSLKEIFEESSSNVIRYHRGIEKAISMFSSKDTTIRNVYNILNWGVAGSGKSNAAYVFDATLYTKGLVTNSFLMNYFNS